MKDAGGHGSNSKLTSAQGPTPSAPRVTGKPAGGHNFTQFHGGLPMSSNAQASQSLMSKLKSTQAPIHTAMAGRPSPDGGSAS
jgi:hypothetical protein